MYNVFIKRSEGIKMGVNEINIIYKDLDDLIIILRLITEFYPYYLWNCFYEREYGEK